ncbi:MAG: hypothetical protein AAF804_19115 [Bacteroidota bacterium]
MALLILSAGLCFELGNGGKSLYFEGNMREGERGTPAIIFDQSGLLG